MIRSVNTEQSKLWNNKRESHRIVNNETVKRGFPTPSPELNHLSIMRPMHNSRIGIQKSNNKQINNGYISFDRRADSMEKAVGNGFNHSSQY